MKPILALLATASLATAAGPTVPPLLIPNHGHAPDGTHFTLRTARHHVAFQNSQLTWTGAGTTVSHTFPGSNPDIAPTAGPTTNARVNLLIGPDPAAWQTELQPVSSLTYPGLYPGIDLLYRLDNNTLKREFLVAPGTDPSVIQLAFEGAEKLTLTPDGHLLIHTPNTTLQEDAPVAWQTHPSGKRTPVTAAFQITSPTTAAFTLGHHDPALPLTIDPPVRLIATLGGSGDDTAFAVVSTPTNYYLAGVSNSSDFPVTDGTTYAGDTDGTGDIVVTALDLEGNITWATYIGGTGTDFANGMVISPDGSTLTVSGWTTSGATFPSLNPVPELTPGAKSDCAVLQLDTAGNLTSASRFGGAEDDQLAAVATDNLAANLAFCGFTNSTDFPFPTENPAAADTTKSATTDLDALFIALNPDLTPRVASYHDRATGFNTVALAISRCRFGEFVLAGWTDDPNFYASGSVVVGGGKEMFVTALRDSDAVRRFTKLRGGAGDDIPQGITFGFSDAIVVVGQTTSTDYPTFGNTFPQDTYGGGDTDGFIHLFDRNSSTSSGVGTFFGGSGDDNLRAVAADPNGFIHFAGSTSSSDLRTVDPAQGTFGGGDTDGVVGTLSVSTSSRSITERFVTYSGIDNSEGFTAVTSLQELPPETIVEPYFPVAAGGTRPPTSPSPLTASKKNKKRSKANTWTPVLNGEQEGLVVYGPDPEPKLPIDLALTLGPGTLDTGTSTSDRQFWTVPATITNNSTELEATNVSMDASMIEGMYAVLPVTGGVTVEGEQIPGIANALRLSKITLSSPIAAGATTTLSLRVSLTPNSTPGVTSMSLFNLASDNPDNEPNNNSRILYFDGDQTRTGTAGGVAGGFNATVSNLPGSAPVTASLRSFTPLLPQPPLPPSIGDPVSLGTGALKFSLPLFAPHGPAHLGATLHHSPEIPRLLPQVPARDSNLLPPHFWLEPYATMVPYIERSPGEFVTAVQFGPRALATFTRNPDNTWSLHTGNLELFGRTLAAADHPVPYTLLETPERMWFVDPQRQLVYEFALGLGSANLLKIHDRNSNTLTFLYQGNSQVPAAVTDDLGRFLNFTYRTGSYPEASYLASLTDHAGRRWTFNYEEDANDNLLALTLRSLTDPGFNTLTFSYAAEPLHAVSSFTLPRGNTPQTNTYASLPWGGITRNRVASQTTADGHTYTFDYDPDTRVVELTNPDTGTTAYTLKGSHLPATSITDPENHTTAHTYNDANQNTATTTPAGDTSTFTYHAPTGNLASATDPLGHTTTYTYTPSAPQSFTAGFGGNTVNVTFHDLARIDLPDGTHIRIDRDSRGNPVRTFDRLGNQTANTFDARGLPLTSTSPTGATSTFTYNPFDATLASSTSSETGTTTYTYDFEKRLAAVAPPVPEGAPADTASVFYDSLDRPTFTSDPENRTRSYEYDTNGNPNFTTDGRFNSSSTTFDDLDRPASSTDRNGNTTTYAYDPMSRLASVTDPTNVTTSYTYDLLGRPASVTRGSHTWSASHDTVARTSTLTSPLGNTTTIARDPLGRTTALTDPSGKTATASYDPLGRATSITDRLRQSTTYAYNPLGNLTTVTRRDALGNPVATASYQRDTFGRLAAVTDFNGQSWPLTFTPEGRLATSTDPLGHTSTTTYDHRGRRATVTHADGRTTTYTYDRSDRLTNTTGSDGTTIDYTYDANGQLASAGDYTFDRDPRGQVTTSTFAGTPYTATYDDAGRLATVSYNDGAVTVTYTYHPGTGLPATVSDDLTGAALTFTYDDDLRLASIARSNTVTTEFTYDANARPTRIRHASMIDMTHTYDAAGRLTSRSLAAPLDPATLLAESDDSLTFDAASRPDSPGYTYDDAGRRTTSPATTHTWDTRNRLTSDGAATYSYDALNRLAQVDSALYHHHPAIPGNPLVAEFDTTTASPLRYYVYAPVGTLVYQIDLTTGTPEPRFHHHDLTGNTLALTGPDGLPADTYAYSPYGQLLAHDGTSTQPFLFNGQLGVRTHNDLLLMGARWYDPATTSFLSPEPIWPQLSQPQRLNPYAFVDHRPNTHIDPQGTVPTRYSHYRPQDFDQGRNDAFHGLAVIFAEFGLVSRDVGFAISGARPAPPVVDEVVGRAEPTIVFTFSPQSPAKPSGYPYRSLSTLAAPSTRACSTEAPASCFSPPAEVVAPPPNNPNTGSSGQPGSRPSDISFGGYGRFGLLREEPPYDRTRTEQTMRFRYQVDSDSGLVFKDTVRIQVISRYEHDPDFPQGTEVLLPFPSASFEQLLNNLLH